MSLSHVDFETGLIVLPIRPYIMADPGRVCTADHFRLNLRRHDFVKAMRRVGNDPSILSGQDSGQRKVDPDAALLRLVIGPLFLQFFVFVSRRHNHRFITFFKFGIAVDSLKGIIPIEKYYPGLFR